MKKILFVILFLLGGLSFNVFGQQESMDRTVVYYFHGNARCVSCRNIEKYTKEALEKYFFDKMASQSIDYQVINVEEEGNGHYTKDYKLYTKSVVLFKVKNGKEVAYKNLEQVWQYLHNKEKFYEYIKEETEKFIKKGEEI
ncbi:MAG: nitrophenyl compound nitroreductase subunit ArsF family protein [Candidatus Zapsychrus exili]|nr:nitrophenyl compound nitroreductase subunit ArsF family protein [Candidatus Zapsychrus exili]